MSVSDKVVSSQPAAVEPPAVEPPAASSGLEFPPDLPRVMIQPTRGWAGLGLRDLRNYKALLYFLAWRDVKVRYKQTVLGAAWAVLQPLFMMLLFTLLFQRVAKIPTPVPYPVFAFTGLLAWHLFAFGLNESSNSLVANQRLISKVYFPRLVMPLAAVVAGLVDFCIAFVLLLGMIAYYQVPPSASMLLVPAFVLLTMLTSLSVGLWLSALNVKYRDVRYTLGFLVQFWMLATPVGYPISVIPEQWRGLYALNPMAGVVEGFRWALLGTGDPPTYSLAVSVVMVILLFVGGLEYFRRMERTFADVI